MKHPAPPDQYTGVVRCHRIKPLNDASAKLTNSYREKDDKEVGRLGEFQLSPSLNGGGWRMRCPSRVVMRESWPHFTFNVSIHLWNIKCGPVHQDVVARKSFILKNDFWILAFLAAIAALYVKMFVGWSVCNEFQS